MLSPKERIIEVTSYLFHQQGYNNTGINQIIKEAKVAKASFYQHFESKEKLCIEFLNNRHEFWFTKLFEFILKGNNMKDKFLLAFDFIIYMNEKENFRGCSFLNILSEISKEQNQILSVIQSHKTDLKKLFIKLAENEIIATHIYLLFESAIIESQMFKSNKIVNQTKSIIKNFI